MVNPTLPKLSSPCEVMPNSFYDGHALFDNLYPDMCIYPSLVARSNTPVVFSLPLFRCPWRCEQVYMHSQQWHNIGKPVHYFFLFLFLPNCCPRFPDWRVNARSKMDSFTNSKNPDQSSRSHSIPYILRKVRYMNTHFLLKTRRSMVAKLRYLYNSSC